MPTGALAPALSHIENCDVGLIGGQTRAVVAERIADGHRSAGELLRFWTALAVCHQAEVEVGGSGRNGQADEQEAAAAKTSRQRKKDPQICCDESRNHADSQHVCCRLMADCGFY